MSRKQAKNSVMLNAGSGNEIVFVTNNNVFHTHCLKCQHIVHQIGPFLDIAFDPSAQ